MKKTKDKILLVEDDEATLESTLFKLGKSGFETDSAEDGEIGLEKLRKNGPFAAVLLDLRMPKGDGFSFLEKKRDDPSVKDVPVVVFTNLSQGEFVKRALELGAAGYLIKANHSLQEIVDELKKCISGGGKCLVDHYEE